MDPKTNRSVVYVKAYLEYQLTMIYLIVLIRENANYSNTGFMIPVAHKMEHITFSCQNKVKDICYYKQENLFDRN